MRRTVIAMMVLLGHLSAVEFSQTMVPKTGCLWGAWSNQSTAGWEADLSALEQQVGRRFDIVHNYHAWHHNIPTSDELARARNGQLLLLNLKPPSGRSWPQVANGDYDADIDRHAANIKAIAPLKVFLAFHHEPEDNVGSYGSVHDYAAAYRHLHDRFKAKGVTNVIWVWNVMGYAGYNSQYTGGLYPGDAYVDWIAWDPYNWAASKGAAWRSFAEIVQPFYDWTAANGLGNKPLMLAEFGTAVATNGDASLKPAWFDDIVPALEDRFPRLKAVVYFNENKQVDWLLSHPAAALPRYAAAGRQPFVNVLFNTPPTAALSASATTGTAPLTVQFSAAGSSDAEGDIARYHWIFGDGSSASGIAPSHTYTQAGVYKARVTVYDQVGDSTRRAITITVKEPVPVSQSYGNDGKPWPIGEQAIRIEAEHYDKGGDGHGYADSSSGNIGQAGRADDVDKEVCTDVSKGLNVGWIAPGEWLAYSVDVAVAGRYRIDLRVARKTSGNSSLHLESVGGDRTSAITVPSTGGWQVWKTVGASIELEAGPQVLKLVFDGGKYNVNWLRCRLIQALPDGAG